MKLPKIRTLQATGGEKKESLMGYFRITEADFVRYTKSAQRISRLGRKIFKTNKKTTSSDLSELTVDLERYLYQTGLVSHYQWTFEEVAKEKTQLDLIRSIVCVKASNFCQRRLHVFVYKLHMASSMEQAIKLVENGGVKVGTQVVKDPGFLVSRKMEKHITLTNHASEEN